MVAVLTIRHSRSKTIDSQCASLRQSSKTNELTRPAKQEEISVRSNNHKVSNDARTDLLSNARIALIKGSKFRHTLRIRWQHKPAFQDWIQTLQGNFLKFVGRLVFCPPQPAVSSGNCPVRYANRLFQHLTVHTLTSTLLTAAAPHFTYFDAHFISFNKVI